MLELLTRIRGPYADQGETLRHLMASVVENTTAAVFVKDLDGRYLLVNRSLERAWGRPRDEIIGRTGHELFPAEIADALRENDRLALERGGTLVVEERTLFADGPRVFLTSKVPLYGEDGRPWAVCGVASDITEIKRVHRELEESEARFRTIADSAPVLIWMSDATGRRDFFNQPWLAFTGRALEDELGHGWRAGIHPEDRVGDEVRQRAVADGARYRLRYRHRRADGCYRALFETGTPRLGSAGELLGFVGSSVDITEQVETEERMRAQAADLAEADRRKDEFLAMLGHELRNPLAPVRNVVELLRLSRASLPENLHWTVDVLDRQTAHLGRLVDDLLDVARISRGKIVLDRRRLDLREVVQSAIETSRPWLDARHHDFAVRVPDHPVCVDGDPMRLAQVISNLLHNAARYTEPGGHIALDVEMDDGEVELRVTDDGQGMSPDFLPVAFELFRQSARSLAREAGGLGIGLTLVQQLVALHGGRVTAASAGPGLGSTFAVRLPVELGDGRPAALPAAAVATTPRRRVLVVDDNHDAARALSRLLEGDGHETLVLHDGHGVEDAVARFTPDVVLLDIGLPGRDGFEVARRLRRGDGQGPLLVAVTGYGQESARHDAERAGFDHHLLKPVRLEELRRLLDDDSGR